MTDEEYWARQREDVARNERLAEEERQERLSATTPKMYRETDPDTSRQFDALVPKAERKLEILRRLRAGGPQTYKTLCDFGHEGGPGIYAGLLTDLRRDGFIETRGKEGVASLYRLTEKGARVAP